MSIYALASALMSDLLSDFERRCVEASISPPDALQAGGVHRSLWSKWKRGKSPTLKNFEAANRGLSQLIVRRTASAGAQTHTADEAA